MIRVAVVGVGVMGKNHVRIYQEIAGVELVAVVDENQTVAEEVGRTFRVPAYSNYLKMIKHKHPDVISAAVPTSAHHSVVKELLEAGCHVLVEKPIANTAEEAEAMIRLAKQMGRVLMVGHIERFNPAVVELKRRLDSGELGRVYQIYARRLGPFPPRIRDVGVVTDLATHDLDIMRYLIGSEVIRVFAEAKRELHVTHEDLFAGVLRFENGMIGLLEINWLTPTKMRELFVTGEKGMFRVDYISQDLFFYQNAAKSRNNWTAADLMHGVSVGNMIQYAIQKKEPLRAELEAFIACIQEKEHHCSNGQDALVALTLAKTLVDSAWTFQVKEVYHVNPDGESTGSKPAPVAAD
jgi:predicted dehydrogenase